MVLFLSFKITLLERKGRGEMRGERGEERGEGKGKERRERGEGRGGERGGESTLWSMSAMIGIKGKQ